MGWATSNCTECGIRGVGVGHTYGDCLNVVNDAKRHAVDALKHNRMHAGAQHVARAEEGQKWVLDNIWVKAHRGITDDMTEETKVHVKANDLADGYAKDARWWYPSNACDRPLDGDLLKVHRLTENAARLIGRIAQIFRSKDPHEKAR